MAIDHEQMTRVVEEEKLRQMMQGKSTGVAVFLSFLIPGLGDLYCGRIIAALFFFGLDLLCAILTVVAGLGFLLYVPVWFLGLVSAWMSAGHTKKAAIKKVEQTLAKAAPPEAA